MGRSFTVKNIGTLGDVWQWSTLFVGVLWNKRCWTCLPLEKKMFSTTKTADSTLLDNFDSFLETPETEQGNTFFGTDNSTMLNPQNDVDMMFLGSTVPLDLEMDPHVQLQFHQQQQQLQQQAQQQQQMLQFQQQQQMFLQHQAAQMGLMYAPMMNAMQQQSPQQHATFQMVPQAATPTTTFSVPQQQQHTSFVQPQPTPTPATQQAYYTDSSSVAQQTNGFTTTTVVISPPQQQQQQAASSYVMKKHILRPQKVERIVYNYKQNVGSPNSANNSTTPPASPPFPVLSHSPNTASNTMNSPASNAAPSSPFSNHLLVQQLMNKQQQGSFFSSAPNSPMVQQPQHGSTPTSPQQQAQNSPQSAHSMMHQQDLFLGPNVTIMENSFGSVKQFYNKQLLQDQRPRSRSCPIPYVQQGQHGMLAAGGFLIPQHQLPQQQQQQQPLPQQIQHQAPAMVLVPKPKNVKKRRRTIFATVTPEDEMTFDFKLKKNNF